MQLPHPPQLFKVPRASEEPRVDGRKLSHIRSEFVCSSGPSVAMLPHPPQLSEVPRASEEPCIDARKSARIKSEFVCSVGPLQRRH